MSAAESKRRRFVTTSSLVVAIALGIAASFAAGRFTERGHHLFNFEVVGVTATAWTTALLAFVTMRLVASARDEERQTKVLASETKTLAGHTERLANTAAEEQALRIAPFVFVYPSGSWEKLDFGTRRLRLPVQNSGQGPAINLSATLSNPSAREEAGKEIFVQQPTTLQPGGKAFLVLSRELPNRREAEDLRASDHGMKGRLTYLDTASREYTTTFRLSFTPDFKLVPVITAWAGPDTSRLFSVPLVDN